MTKTNSDFPGSPKDIYIIVILCCIAGIAYLSKHVFKYLRTRNWKSTDGVIIDANVTKIDDSEGALYEPLVQYKFIVNGNEFISERIFPYVNFNRSSFYSVPAKVVTKYCKGQVVEIFYNSKIPRESCISKKGLMPYLVIISGFIMIIIFMLTAIYGIIEL